MHKSTHLIAFSMMFSKLACYCIIALLHNITSHNSKSESKLNLSSTCAYQNVSVLYLRYERKYLLRRVPYASNGSFNPYVITYKETHIVNGNILNADSQTTNN